MNFHNFIKIKDSINILNLNTTHFYANLSKLFSWSHIEMSLALDNYRKILKNYFQLDANNTSYNFFQLKQFINNSYKYVNKKMTLWL